VLLHAAAPLKVVINVHQSVVESAASVPAKEPAKRELNKKFEGRFNDKESASSAGMFSNQGLTLVQFKKYTTV